MENFSQGSRLVLDTSRCIDLAGVLVAATTGLLCTSLLGCPWVPSATPWLAQVPFKLSN
jgi:hypothetical protein